MTIDYSYEYDQAAPRTWNINGADTKAFIDTHCITRTTTTNLDELYLSEFGANQSALSWLVRKTSEALQRVNGYAIGKEMHPTVEKALKKYETEKWFEIALTQPHISATDSAKVDYYRSRTDIAKGRVTTTTIGKFLKMSFPEVADNLLRDIAATWSPDEFKFLTDGYDIVLGVQTGPKSCMKWNRHFNHENWKEHPYACYTPENGWSLAVRISASNIEARCLCHDYKGNKIFVRSFGNTVSGENDHSQSDTALEAWLKDQGYEHVSGWHKTCQIETYGNKLFPYIDGSVDRVDGNGYIVHDGEYLCGNQDGTADNNDMTICDQCGDRYDPDDEGSSVGYDGDYQVCDSCCQSYYIYVKGYRGYEYYIRDRDAIYVSSQDQHYDPEHLSDNDIVELHDGEYEHYENATYVERHDSYYLNEEVAYTVHDEHELMGDCERLHDGDWALRERDDVYFCCISHDWYCSSNGDPEPVLHDDGIANPINVKEELEAEGQMVLELL